MTKEVVLKPFNSANRRFNEGDVVHANDDFAPLTYGQLKMRHFIGEPKKGGEAQSKADKAAKVKDAPAATPHAYPAPKPPSAT